VDAPVQYFQSIIAIELAVTGALLWQIRFFDSTAPREGEHVTHPRLRLLLAAVLGATLFVSLWAMAHEGKSWAASAVTVGLAVSLLPILLRVLPPLARNAATLERDANYGVTVVGLVLYTAAVAGVVVLLNL
jgi:glucose-6-phosphate-specific signal transduction histidine kinase